MADAKVDAVSVVTSVASLAAAGASVAGVLAIVPSAYGLFSYWENRKTAALLSAQDQMLWEWVIAEKNAMVEQVRQLCEMTKDVERVKTRVDELLSDPQFARIRDNYGFEATREAVDERRRMLAYASAGSVNLDLTIAELARVERTIRELDPDDLELLHRFTAVPDPPKPQRLSPDENVWKQQLTEWGVKRGPLAEKRLEGADDREDSVSVLVASGCVYVGPFLNTWGSTSKNGLTVTTAGERVLRVALGYLRARGTGSDV